MSTVYSIRECCIHVGNAQVYSIQYSESVYSKSDYFSYFLVVFVRASLYILKLYTQTESLDCILCYYSDTYCTE